MKADQVEEGEITDAMAKDNGKDRDRPRSKSGTQSKSREAERRLSKFSENKPVEVPPKKSSKVETSKASTTSASSKDASRPTSAREEPTSPLLFDKKEVWENVRKYELKLAEEVDVQAGSAETYENLQDFVCVVKEIMELKMSSKVSEDDLEALKLEGLLLVGKVRHFNRLCKIRLNSVKGESSSGRARVDKDHLLLQNLLYEATHLKKQVESVQDYKGQDEEIDLIPIAEFYEKAPPSVSKPDITKNNDHLLRIARLEHEFILRQNLTNNCSQLEKSKELVATEIDSSRKKLESLRPMLQTVLESTKPVQNFFGMSSWQENDEQQIANDLPPPLYILYVQSSSYRNAFPIQGGSLDVKIQGDVESAKEFVAAKDSDNEDAEEDSDTDVEMDDNEDDNRDNEMSMRRKSRKGSTARGSSMNPLAKLTEMHPLWVEWTLKIPSGESVTVKFLYATKLNVVTVKCLVAGGVFTDRLTVSPDFYDNILTELFPGDNGIESPNPTTNHILRKARVETFSILIPQIGKPYRWAQKVAGLDFPLLVPPMLSNDEETKTSKILPSPKYSTSKVENTVKEVLIRLRNQANLWSQIRVLETKNVTLQADKRNFFPAKISSHFVSWEAFLWSEDITLQLSKLLLDTKKIATSADNKDMFFRAVVERGRVKLKSYVLIRMDFPAVPPVFTLVMEKDGEEIDASHDSGLQGMERELNFNAPLDYKEHSDSLLVMQIQKMLVLLDVFLESTHLQNRETSGPSEFRHENLFSSPSRGRNRRQPFQYQPVGGGVFTQRF